MNRARDYQDPHGGGHAGGHARRVIIADMDDNFTFLGEISWFLLRDRHKIGYVVSRVVAGADADALNSRAESGS